ncbi:Alpha/beta hydrolase family protein [Brevibacterium sp. 239c]|uniref:alpha/beta hydrolase family protein n=1 Tax=Brevibacterium sp. 239c TaxID=1965356 RepID=UPI000C37CC07|nr:alpha/beta fold hydrolase [Brevibacterium sp. 239c]SMX83720.1 Alpha/beta hydrolase family protein [Brevibacterium sp. 239c]
MTQKKRNEDIGNRGGGRSVLFRNGTMDFLAGWLLGYSQQGGLSPGALLHCYSLIRDGDPRSWVSVFAQAGEEAADRAEQAGAAARNREVAREWSAAQIAFRAALEMCDPRTSEAADLTGRMRHAFEAYLAASGVPLIGWDVEFRDSYFPAYVTPSVQRAEQLLVIVGGGDTYVEDLWFFGGKAAIERGWPVLLADYPGQGDTPSRGLHFGEQTIDGMRQVVDDIREQGFHGELVMLGWSGGGIFATRFAATARSTDRVSALVASTPIYDPGTFFRRTLPDVVQGGPDSVLVRAALGIARRNRVLRTSLDRYDWQFGAGGISTIADRFDELKVDLSTWRLPVLALVGLGEDSESLRQAQGVIKQAQVHHPSSELVTFDPWTGAQAHCQVGNLPLALAQVFDWLEAPVLAQERAAS